MTTTKDRTHPHNLSHTAVAELIGASLSTVSRVRNGHRLPSVSLMCRMGRFLGLAPVQMVEWMEAIEADGRLGSMLYLDKVWPR